MREARRQEVLKEARRIRAGEVALVPSLLYAKAGGDSELYREGLIHAGAVGPEMEGDYFLAYEICPYCGETV